MIDALTHTIFISLKKISKNLLPYTIKAKLSGNDGNNDMIFFFSTTMTLTFFLSFFICGCAMTVIELKELQTMLEDPQNSDEDIDNIHNAVQRFKKCENILELHKADVVGKIIYMLITSIYVLGIHFIFLGTTCSASSFEIFSESQFPFILMDECSQVMEPLSLVPLLRFKCSKMVMIGDPKQVTCKKKGQVQC
jgi:hypothetical protein